MTIPQLGTSSRFKMRTNGSMAPAQRWNMRTSNLPSQSLFKWSLIAGKLIEKQGVFHCHVCLPDGTSILVGFTFLHLLFWSCQVRQRYTAVSAVSDLLLFVQYSDEWMCPKAQYMVHHNMGCHQCIYIYITYYLFKYVYAMFGH